MTSRLGISFHRLFDPERKAWRGEAQLAVVFWGYGVAFSLGIAVLYGAMLQRGYLAFQQAIILFSAPYSVWIVIVIWRSAAHSRPLWGTLARLLTIAWGFNSALVLLFLQIELALRYVRE